MKPELTVSELDAPHQSERTWFSLFSTSLPALCLLSVVPVVERSCGKRRRRSRYPKLCFLLTLLLLLLFPLLLLPERGTGRGAPVGSAVVVAVVEEEVVLTTVARATTFTAPAEGEEEEVLALPLQLETVICVSA